MSSMLLRENSKRNELQKSNRPLYFVQGIHSHEKKIVIEQLDLKKPFRS